MTVDKSWQLGEPGTLVYRLYDSLRKRLNHKLVGFLAATTFEPSGNRVLEAGSGPAFASSMMRQRDDVRLSVAVDIDIEALREARRRDLLLCAVVADLHHLPFKADSFGLVWNSSTLEHLETCGAALVEMARVTEPGRCVFVGVPFASGPLGFQRWIANTGAGVWIGTVFSRAGLVALLTDARLTPQDEIRYFFRFFIGMTARK